jgi:hypothetical protein
MIVEFQIDPQPFLVRFRNRIKEVPVCITQSASITEGGCSGPCLLDHLNVWEGTALQRDADGTVLIVQPIDLHIVQISDLEANGALPSKACWAPTIGLVFRFSVGMDDGTNTPQLTPSRCSREWGCRKGKAMRYI